MPRQEYTYKVTEVIRVIDGDTFWLTLDVGFRAHITVKVRLWGFDTPERVGVSTDERKAAEAAKSLSSIWLAANATDLWVRTEKDPDNFGRWLGEVTNGEWETLGSALRESGLASRWPTRWREEFG